MIILTNREYPLIQKQPIIVLPTYTKKEALLSKNLLVDAEAGGFEPPVRKPVRQFSKLVVSATHPHFLTVLCILFSFALQR